MSATTNANTNPNMNAIQPSLTPYLTVFDAEAAISFYERAFGARVIERHPSPDGKRLLHASIFINDHLLMLSDDFPEMNSGRLRNPRAIGGTAVTLHLNVPDADAIWANATKAGAMIILPLAEQAWGDRYGILEDPYGHRWSIATPKPADAVIGKGKGASALKPFVARG